MRHFKNMYTMNTARAALNYNMHLQEILCMLHALCLALLRCSTIQCTAVCSYATIQVHHATHAPKHTQVATALLQTPPTFTNC